MITSEEYDDLQELFSEKQSYVIEPRLQGDITIFPETFIRVLREAFSTGCMSKMGEEEIQLVRHLIAYEEDIDTPGINTGVVEDLDGWIMNIINCEPNPVINACFLQPDHTYNDCGMN